LVLNTSPQARVEIAGSSPALALTETALRTIRSSSGVIDRDESLRTAERLGFEERFGGLKHREECRLLGC
jgi:hypothetical protein